MPSAPIRFVVIDENILGYVHPQIPLTAFILASRGGATCGPLDHSRPLALDPAWVRSEDCPKPLDLVAVAAGRQPVKFDPAHVRPALRADFDTFRLHSEGYASDPRYAFPRA